MDCAITKAIDDVRVALHEDNAALDVAEAAVYAAAPTLLAHGRTVAQLDHRCPAKGQFDRRLHQCRHWAGHSGPCLFGDTP